MPTHFLLYLPLIFPVEPGPWNHHRDPWSTFKHLDKHDTPEKLEHYVVELVPGEERIIHCDSNYLDPELIPGLMGLNMGIPQKPQLYGQNHTNPTNKPCTFNTTQGRGFQEKSNTCYYRVNYTTQETWYQCKLKLYPRTYIRLVTVPKRVPYVYKTTPKTNHLDWWCLRNRNATYVNAGHLLWLYYTTIDDRPIIKTFQTVERFKSWNLEPGDYFECNGTVWEWGEDISCLKILPSGWPALVHCHGFEQFLVISTLILIFVFIYINGVMAYNAYFFVKLKVSKRKRFRQKLVPLVIKDRKLPYSNMADIGQLEKRVLIK